MPTKQADISPTIRIVAFFAIVAVATFGLAIVYKALPTDDRVATSPSASQQHEPVLTGVAVKPDADRSACEQGGGLWTECGDSCRGSVSGTTCISACERQCVCGGTRGWTCGAGLTCTRLTTLPGLGTVGVCQGVQADPTALGAPTSTATTTAALSTAATSTPVFTGPMQTIDAALLPRAICSEDRSFCLLRAKDLLEGATFTWPLKLKGTAFLDERFSRMRWDLRGISGGLFMGDKELVFTRSTSTPTQISWSLTIPKPVSGAAGTKRVQFTLTPGDNSGDFTSIHSVPSVEFYAK